jgi:hypothetical protein
MTNPQNRKVRYEGTDYEIFWTSEYAEHIGQNYTKKSHAIWHTEIGAMICDRDAMITRLHLHPDRYEIHAQHAKTLYITVVAFNEKYLRCVVVTSYIENRELTKSRYAEHKARQQTERRSRAQQG